MTKENTHTVDWTILSDALLILALSGIVIPLLQRFKISPILGYLLCGLLIGPHAFGTLDNIYPVFNILTITDMKLIAFLAELGVVFLLFMIGLELTLSRLWRMRKLVLGLGNAQIIFTAFVIGLIALQFNNSIQTSILIGAAFALSSTAIVMQILTDQRMLSKPTGQLCFSVLLMQDLAVVPILVLISAFASANTDSNILIMLAKALGMAAITVCGIFAAGKLVLRPAFALSGESKNVEWLFSIVLLLVLGCAYLTHSFGLSAALGAFLAGLLIAETEYRHEIEVIIAPVKGLLMGVFFLSVGMSTNLASVIAEPIWIPVSVIGIFLIKSTVFYVLARLLKNEPRQSARAAIMLAQCGEFAFIVIGLAMSSELLPAGDGQFFMLVATVSMLLTPFTVKLVPFVEKIPGISEQQQDQKHGEFSNFQNHIILIGFGRVGKMLGQIFEDQAIPYLAIDNNREHAANLHKNGYPVIAGEAAHIKLLEKMNIAHAKICVITINDFTATKKIIRTIKTRWPHLDIIVRASDIDHVGEYYTLGADEVVPEELELGLQLANLVLNDYENSSHEVKGAVEKFRTQVSESLSGHSEKN